jgi:hypothetical protein
MAFRGAALTPDLAEKSQGIYVRPFHQPKENVVEYRDLAFVEAVGVSQK